MADMKVREKTEKALSVPFQIALWQNNDSSVYGLTNPFLILGEIIDAQSESALGICAYRWGKVPLSSLFCSSLTSPATRKDTFHLINTHLMSREDRERWGRLCLAQLTATKTGSVTQKSLPPNANPLAASSRGKKKIK